MQLSGEWKIIIGATFFALIPVGVKIGDDLSVYALLFGRLFVASIILYAINKHRKYLFQLKLSELLKLVWWSLIMLSSMISYFLAIRYSGMSVASAILGTQPILIVFMAAIIFKERIHASAMIASVVALIGIFMIIRVDDLFNSNYFLGEMLAIVSAIMASLNFVYKKKYLNEYKSNDLVFYQSLFQLPFLLPFFWLTENVLTLKAIGAVTMLGIMCSVFAYTLIYNGIKTVHPQKIGILQGIEYILPVIIGILFFQERPDWMALTGVFLILISCFIVVGIRKKKTEESLSG